MQTKKKININLADYTIWIVLILFWVILLVASSKYHNVNAFISILQDSSYIGIAALGMTFCIISGDFDLSIGRMVPMLMIIIITMSPVIGEVPAIFLAICISIVCGLWNGFLVAVIKVPAFIATLTMYYVFAAFGLFISGEQEVRYEASQIFKTIGRGSFLMIPISFWIFLGLTICTTIFLRKTKFGRNVVAMGNSQKASYVSGVNIVRTKILIFVIVAFFASLSAVVLTSKLGAAMYDTKDGFEFTVITAVVLGGTPLAGGKGKVVNTMIASLFMSTITSAFTIFAVPSYTQKVINGIILLLAFALGNIRALISDHLVKVRSHKEYLKQQNNSV